MDRSKLIKKLEVIVSLFIALTGICASSVWAGGNKQFRDPADRYQVHNSVWDSRMLPLTWEMSSDGIPGSGITNAAIISEFSTAFNGLKSLATSSLDFQFGGEGDRRRT